MKTTRKQDILDKILYEVEREFTILAQRKKIEERYVGMLQEAYGTIDEQYYIAKFISNEIIDKYKRQEYSDTTDYYVITVNYNSQTLGELTFITKWRKRHFEDVDVYGSRISDNWKTIISIIVDAEYSENIESYLAGTIAHEIMHSFQTSMTQVKGVSNRSMILYNYLPSFYNTAPSDFTRYFFYGLYICYHIETTANISSVWNYLESHFNGQDKSSIRTEEIENAVSRYPKYKMYAEVLDEMTNGNIREQDKNYIKTCMCKTMTDFFNNNTKTNLFNKETFNVDTFIDKTRQQIINTCNDTLKKMRRNTTNYINHD